MTSVWVAVRMQETSLIYETEVDTGSEDTFREMLRIKRAVQSQYNTDVCRDRCSQYGIMLTHNRSAICQHRLRKLVRKATPSQQQMLTAMRRVVLMMLIQCQRWRGKVPQIKRPRVAALDGQDLLPLVSSTSKIT